MSKGSIGCSQPCNGFGIQKEYNLENIRLVNDCYWIIVKREPTIRESQRWDRYTNKRGKGWRYLPHLLFRLEDYRDLLQLYNMKNINKVNQIDLELIPWLSPIHSIDILYLPNVSLFPLILLLLLLLSLLLLFLSIGKRVYS